MKRLALSAVISVALHVLVLGFHVEWSQRDSHPIPVPPAISLALTYPVVEKESSLPRPRPVHPELPPEVKKALPEMKDLRPRGTVKEEEPLTDDRPTRTGPSQEEAAARPAEETRPRPLPADTEFEQGSVRASLSPPLPLREAIPVYRENPAPGYPRVARRRAMEGTVLLEVLVSSGGRVKDLRVSQSSGHEVLDQAAVDAVRRWIFEPAQRGGEAVEMWVRVPIRFQLK